MTPPKATATVDPATTDATNGAGSEEVARKPLLVILDSHGIIFRSYYALRDVLTVRRTGEPVAAVFGYANSLLTVFNDLQPTHVIAAWDASSETFRKQTDERYKANREATPEELVPQFDRVRELLDAFHIPLVERPGYEADDILGTFARQAAAQGIDTIIVTLDNDIVQLVEPHVRVYMYRLYQRDYVMYDEEAVRERFGFEPRQMIDYKALVGDTSDNIPGVKGIGEKGAKALIEEWGSLEAMIEHIDELKPPRAQKALVAGLDEAKLSKELATIVTEVPDLELSLDGALLQDYDRERVLKLFQELEFRSLMNRLPESTRSATTEPVVGLAAAGNYEAVTQPAQLAAMVKAIRKAGRFSIEVIADDAHPIRAADSLVGVALSCEAEHAWYVPFGHRDPAAEEQQQSLLEPVEEPQAATEQLPRAAVLEALRPLLEDPALKRIGHDVKFALLALAGTDGGTWAHSVDFDTQVAAYLLGDLNMTLQKLAFDRLGAETVEPKDFLGTGRKAIPFADASVEDVTRYAASNADYVVRLEAVLAEQLKESNLESVFNDIDLPHIPVLARMEQFGVALDTSVLARLSVDLVERIAQAERESYAAVGHEFKLGSPQELSQVLFEELELPHTRKTKTGYTTDADALGALREAHPVINAVLTWRELTKIKSTYVDSLPLQVNPRTNRVHTIFSQSTAATGRLSSNDPNLQNIPVRTELGQEVRRAFIARDCGEDPILFSIDYSQIELRVLAHVAGDDGLRDAFDRGLDIHAATAANVFHVDLADITPDMRRRAKVFNFGVLYGLTAFGLSQREGVDFDEANAFIDAYFEAYPKVQEWRERTVEETRKRGYAETLTGRRRPIPDLYSGNRNIRQAAERIAINMPIQGTASDIIKIAMNNIDRELIARREGGMLARMVLQVHDELIFELPRAELDDVREVARRLMPSIELAVPLDLDEKLGTSWGDFE
ncbi:MAG: DNA polymerase I [Chloroflexi bacterium]|nr:DNA polymerase I [Chloroflexota bacterium]MDA1146644.1 DNA polymerase I [Chloroflexota bacterium]MQC82814.1 DNA polymerase I [Chloroflexota bacterium]